MNIVSRIIRSARIRTRLKKWLEPEFHPKIQLTCEKEFLGPVSYGGWQICPTNISHTSIVYSFGVGEDISFDLAIIKKYGVSVHAFDPTPKSIEWVKSQRILSQFIFHAYGVADYDGVAQFYPPENPEHVSYTMLNRPETADHVVELPVHRISTIMKMLGHSNIDILKMDIEGAEYDFLEDLIRSKIPVDQILVEFHHHFRNVSVSKTQRAIKFLNAAGFRLSGRTSVLSIESIVGYKVHSSFCIHFVILIGTMLLGF